MKTPMTTTIITIHDEKGKILDTIKDVEFKKEDIKDGVILQDLELEIDKKHLKSGKNTLYVVINSDFNLTKVKPIEKEKNLENNKIEMILNIGTADFEIHPSKYLITHNLEDNKEVNIGFEVLLTGIDETIDTIVDLYRGNKLIESKNIKVKGNNKVNLSFEVYPDNLEKGSNNFTAVVNADYDLKTARPYKEETFLENNKTGVIVLVEDEEEKSVPCSFKGRANQDTFGLYECKEWGSDEEGNPVCLSGWQCYYYTVGTRNSSELEYIEYEMRSDIYRPDKPGQEYGKSKRVPKGKNLQGKPAHDSLMAKIGYNPLYQVIQTGRGMQVKGKIKLTGEVQDFDPSRIDKTIKAFVDDIKENIYAGSKAKNNQGKEYQEVIEDKTRDGKYNVSLVNTEEFGEDRCKKIYRYTKTFNVEIPIIIDKATGTIDIINRNPKPKNPNENKYFVYMNTQNGVYQMKLRTDINPRILGVSQGITRCIIEPEEFKFAIYGSMFDLINTGGTNEDPYWDN